MQWLKKKKNLSNRAGCKQMQAKFSRFYKGVQDVLMLPVSQNYKWGLFHERQQRALVQRFPNYFSTCRLLL